MGVIRNTGAAVGGGEGGRELLSFVNSLRDPRERYNAMVTVLLHAGRGQAVDEFTLADCGPEFSDGRTQEERFRDYVLGGRVDTDRVHRIDGRYFAFETEHFVYPYAGGYSKEYVLKGVCVSDMLDGVNLSRMAEMGVGDSSTMVYAGKDPVIDGKRVSELRKELLEIPAFKRKPAMVTPTIKRVEETLSQLFPVKLDGTNRILESRLHGRFMAVLGEWHPNEFPSATDSVKDRIADAVLNAVLLSHGLQRSDSVALTAWEESPEESRKMMDAIHRAYSSAVRTDEVIGGRYAEDFAGTARWSRALDFPVKGWPEFKGFRYIDFKDCTNVHVILKDGESRFIEDLSMKELRAVYDGLQARLSQKVSKQAGIKM